MSETKKRELCHKCNKNNYCTWEYEGKEYSGCKTEGCNTKYISATNSQQKESYIDSSSLKFEYPDINYRGISPKTCEFLGIKVVKLGEIEIVQYEHNNLDGSFDKKIRYPGKIFEWKGGETDTPSLFAIDKCIDFTKPLYLTEGNEDCATLWELGYQASSLRSAGTAIRDCTNDLEYINQFPEIILCIENDKAGKKVKENLKELLKHKLIKVVDLSPRKDANDWINGIKEKPDPEELQVRLKNAEEVIPKGVVFGDTLDLEALWIDPPSAIPFPWPKLNDAMVGLEYGQLYGILGGSSIGKSSFMRELVYYLRIEHSELKIANIFLEENQKISPLSYIALHENIPLGKLKRDKSLIPEEKRQELQNSILKTDKLMFIDDFYERDSENLIKTIKYLANVKNYDIIILDHISYVIGRSKVSKHGERRDVDELLYQLQDLARNLNIIIVFACHLVDPDNGKKWDEGRIPSMYSGRGSRVLAQVPDALIGISRNMKDPLSVDIMQIHSLKNRWDGLLGLCDELIYINSTGRLILK